MFSQYIKIKDKKWNIVVYYNVTPDDFFEIEESLMQIECPMRYINSAFDVLSSSKNTGFTFSNSNCKMSIVCISKTTSASQFVNTVVHEAKHVQSHICSFYNVKEDSEQAAYLIGYIVRKMYKMVAKVLKNYVRFIGK